MAGEYCTTTDIKMYNQYRTYDTTSYPTAVQAAGIIKKTQAQINARFSGAGISVPITTSATNNAYLYVNWLCSIGSAGYIEEAAYMGGNKQDSEHSMSLLDRFYSELDKIEKNPQIMNAYITGQQYRMDSYELSNSDEAREDVSDEPFARDTDYW